MTDPKHISPPPATPRGHSSDDSATPTLPMSITDIMAVLPHRYPLLMIDRVTELTRRKRIVALKNVTVNEHFFTGHFPSYPVMPGVLIVEAMAQAGATLLLTEFPDREKKLVFFTSIERAKFRKPVVPGDQLRLEIDVIVWKSSAGKMQGKAFVGDKLVCEAIISCAVVNK